MAPVGNSAKALQQNRPRPAVPRAIIPAIPLPYVQKRQQQQEAARAKAREEAAATPVVETPSSPTLPAIEATPTIVNGSSENAPEKAEEIAELSSPAAPATIEPVVEEEVREPAGAEAETSRQEEIIEEQQEVPKPAPSDTQSSASRSTYHMPPSFVPANQNHPSATNTDPVEFPPQPTFNGHYPMHHAHPSSGSVMFGAYPESNNSSPAPPSAGNAPPYPFPQQSQHGLARHGPHQSNSGHSNHMSNGYSPMGPPPGYYPRQEFINQGPGADFARRQMMSFGPPDGYSPSATPLAAEGPRANFDPSTPHSFHGSQSSAPNEQESSGNGPAFYSQYPTAVISNGSNGHIDEVRLYQQPRPKPRTGSQPLAPAPNNYPVRPTGQPPLQMDHLDGLVNYLQSQFADPSFADYTLELRYSDDRAPPVRIPGHNLMFARSPTLKRLMTSQASDGMMVRTLLIESDDRFLRSDAFWMAVQRLYGGPLLDLGAMAAISSLPATQSSVPLPGTPADRFDLGLGYAAAGHILQVPPVITRGIEIASHFLAWTTVEKALDFALDGGMDCQWTDRQAPNTTYGPATNILIHSAMNYIITSFPAGFKLDTSVGDTRNRRLPTVQDDRPAAANPRLSFIKFGDHPSEESVRSASCNSNTITLSKILLNLPFPLLKYVLESSRLGNVQGWATTVLRQEVMHTVVEERERRRMKIHSSAVSNAERNLNAEEWGAVGWQEIVEPLGGNEATPTLNRAWVDFTVPES